MISLVLAMLLVGSGAQFSSFGSLSNTFNTNKLRGGNNLGVPDNLGIANNFGGLDNLGVVNTVTNGVNGATRSVVGLADSTREGNVLSAITTGVKKEVGAVAQPVESAVLMTTFSQCELVKQALGVEYIPRSSLKDEDLKQLTLQFITPSLRIIYNLTKAAELIPASRDFNPDLPLIIFAHGFLSVPGSERFSTLVEAFQRKGEYNVLALDSSAYIFWFYLRATTYVRYVGERLGEILAALVERGLNPKAIHLIGHSLGAHISGFAGKEFTQLTGERVGRISGLDPAGPCFFNVGSELKLNAADADFVDVIHTNDGCLGITEPVGQSDFYPNGGTQQPGCVSQICSHEIVWKMYAESIINPEAFVAVRCTGWDQFRANQCERNKVVMGYGATPDVQGLFFLETRSSSPYGLGEAGVIYTNTEGVLKSIQPLGPGAPLG